MKPKISAATWLLLPMTVATLAAIPSHAQPSADPVLVENGSVKLYRSEYDAELKKLPGDIRPGFANSARRVNDLLTRLIVQKTLAEQARQQKLVESPEYALRYQLEVDRVLAQMRVAQVEDLAAKDFDARRAQFEPRARELYLVDRKKYETPEQVSASHILFDLRKHSKEEGEKLAAAARAKIAAGADFNVLAKEISEDPTAGTNGGRLDYFGKADMDPVFADAAFALKNPGDVSPPVLSQFGWHVIKLEARRPGSARTFDEVRDLMMAELRKKYIDEKRDAVVNGIRADPAQKVNQEAVDALVIRVDPETVKRMMEEAAKAAPPAGPARK